MPSTIFIAFLAMLLGGCTIQQQQRQQAEFQNSTSALNAELRNELDGNRKLDPIREKISLHDAREATLQMLSLTSFPSENEKRALEEWQGMVNSFRPKAMSHVQKHMPWALPMFDMIRAAGLTLVSDLYIGKINYGQYNRQRLEMTTKYLQALQELQRQQAQLAQAQAQTAAQQSMAASAAIAGLQNYLLGQQLINQQLQPARIAPFTCTRYGNITNCH